MSTGSYTTTRFSAADAALVLIDHQSGILQLVHDYSPAGFRNAVFAGVSTRTKSRSRRNSIASSRLNRLQR